MGRSSKAIKSNNLDSSKRGSYEYETAITQVQQGDASRVVILHCDVNEQSISSVMSQMLYLSSLNHKPIHLLISTYGGSVDEMFLLYDTIKFLPCPVHTIALGKVMSAGVLLLAAGEKGKRMIGQSARIMMHPISGGSMGNIFEIINDVEESKRLQEQMTDAICRETKLSKESIEKIMKSGHDVYLSPKEAVEMGIVDKIIGE